MRGLLACGVFALLARGLGAVELDIPVFAGGYGIGFYEESARQFEALNPGVSIRLYGDPRIADQVRVRVIAGNFPDAACVANVLWPALIRAGRLVPLDSFLDGPDWEGDASWRSTFFPGALDTWQAGRIYGLPVSFSCWTIFYNKALFRERGWTAPRTWDEFFALCERIKAAGLAPLSVPGTSWLYADSFLRAACHDLMGAEGWAAVNSLKPGARLDPRYARAAALEQRVMQRCAMRGWEGESHTGAELSFLQGRAAMTVSGSWLVNEMAGKFPEGFELGAMNFPVFADGAADPTSIQTGSDCFFVFQTGDPTKEKLCIDFLRFLTSRSRAGAFVRELDAPVAVKGVPLDAYSPRMRDTAGLILGARDAYAMPQTMMQPPTLRQALVDESERLTRGAIAPDEFASRLEAAAAEDRDRAEHPDRVVFRHPVAGGALIAAMGAVVIWLLWGKGISGRPMPLNGRPVLLNSQMLTFVLPALLPYAAFVLLPGMAAFTWAFTRWDGLSPRAWLGLANFRRLLFESDGFWQALRNNLYLTVVPALIVIPVALVCAALIHRGVRGGSVFKVVFLFPNMLGGIAAILIWLCAYQPHGGLVNAGLAAMGRVLHLPWLAGFDGHPWLAPEHLYSSLIPIYLWMACGFNMILFLAAMEGIDPQLYEAAEIDGASKRRQFFAITLPMIREAIAIAAAFLVIGGLNAFEMIWLLTSQNPTTTTHTMGTLLVTSMFSDLEIGRATALAVVMFVLVFAASAALSRMIQREESET